MKKPQIIITIIFIIFTTWAYVWQKNHPVQDSNDSQRELITSAIYRCDNDKTINATYYRLPNIKVAQQGEMPIPNGQVDIKLDNGEVMTLDQTISASGVRYATNDEAFVFWNKGNEAIIMRDNSMDLNYKNCTEIENN